MSTWLPVHAVSASSLTPGMLPDAFYEAPASTGGRSKQKAGKARKSEGEPGLTRTLAPN